jgi:hypothetical protein
VPKFDFKNSDFSPMDIKIYGNEVVQAENLNHLRYALSQFMAMLAIFKF